MLSSRAGAAVAQWLIGASARDAGVYLELVQDSGWSTERFSAWVADTLELHLLGRPERR